MEVTTHDRKLTLTQYGIAGGAAGVTARTLTAPLHAVRMVAAVGPTESLSIKVEAHNAARETVHWKMIKETL